jgi:hypothetical protein
VWAAGSKTVGTAQLARCRVCGYPAKSLGGRSGTLFLQNEAAQKPISRRNPPLPRREQVLESHEIMEKLRNARAIRKRAQNFLNLDFEDMIS